MAKVLQKLLCWNLFTWNIFWGGYCRAYIIGASVCRDWIFLFCIPALLSELSGNKISGTRSSRLIELSVCQKVGGRLVEGETQRRPDAWTSRDTLRPAGTPLYWWWWRGALPPVCPANKQALSLPGNDGKMCVVLLMYSADVFRWCIPERDSWKKTGERVMARDNNVSLFITPSWRFSFKIWREV